MADDVFLNAISGVWDSPIWNDITTGHTTVADASDDVYVVDAYGGLISGDGSADELVVATPYSGSIEFDGTILTYSFELSAGPPTNTAPGLIVSGGDLETSENFNVAAGATLSVSGDGSLTGPTDGGGMLQDFGEIDVNSGVVTSDQLDVYGTFDLISGTASASTLAVGSSTEGNTGEPAQVTVGDGSTITVSGVLAEGVQAGAGTITVNGGVVTVGDEADFGDDSGGFGSLTLTAGGSVTVTGTLDAGGVAGGGGTISVSGSGSDLSVGGDAIIGDAGFGTAAIAGGAMFSVSGDLTIGSTAGSSGTITISDDDSLLDDSGDLTVGNSGTGELDINQGSIDVFTGAVTLGKSTGGSGSVSLQDTALDLSGTLTIGDAGSGSLAVGSSANLQAQDIVLGAMTGGSGDLVVAGDEATGQSSGLTIGTGGTGMLEVSAQGSLDTTGIAILGAVALPLVTVQATINGLGAWTVGSELDVGAAGNASIMIGTGGQVSAGSVLLGDQAGATGTVTVDGTIGTSGVGTAASSLFYGGALTVGNEGTASLTVSDGGIVGLAGDGTIAIGQGYGGAGTVSVFDPGSTLYASVLAVGGSLTAAGGKGVLSIGNGGSVVATDVTVWATGSIDLAGGSLITDPVTILGDVTGYGSIGGAIVNDGTIIAAGGTLVLSSNTISGSGLVEIDSGSDALVGPVAAGGLTFQLDGSASAAFGGAIGGGNTIDFSGSGDSVSLAPSGGVYDPAASFVGFNQTDTLVLTGSTITSATFVSGTLDLFDGLMQVGSLDLTGNYAGDTFTTGTNSAGESVLTVVMCFLAGTLIATPSGQVPVEHLSVGDPVLTHAGRVRPIVWIGSGRVLATRGRRNAATPVLVRKGALGANVPHSDLRVTKAHGLFVDGVLIPVEFLVNHRTILWDDHAQEVSLYHVELETHDVLLANGAPAESFRDDGNRWLFANANVGWDLPPLEPCAPVLTGGPVVDAVWRRLLERGGQRPALPLTDDADVHLVVDGQRLDAIEQEGDVHVFRLPGTPSDLRIVSRAGTPAELGVARDPRVLGVALRGMVVRKGARFSVIKAGDDRLADGFHAFEPDNTLRWTDGEAIIPADVYAGFAGSFEVVLDIGAVTRYLADESIDRVA